MSRWHLSRSPSSPSISTFEVFFFYYSSFLFLRRESRLLFLSSLLLLSFLLFQDTCTREKRSLDKGRFLSFLRRQAARRRDDVSSVSPAFDNKYSFLFPSSFLYLSLLIEGRMTEGNRVDVISRINEGEEIEKKQVGDRTNTRNTLLTARPD